MYSSGPKRAPQYCPSPSRKTFSAPRPLTAGKNKSASIPLVCVRRLRTRIGGFRRRQVELRQVREDSFIKINDTALDLLEYKGRGQDFHDGSKKESGVLTHRCSRDNVRHPMGNDGLVAGVVDAGKISRDHARLAIGGGLLAHVRR